MNKAYLVALREYMENLKTKTFWIGILIFPVILVLSICVPIWMEKGKDIRHYAVIDNSGDAELLPDIFKRAALPDMERVLTYALKQYEKKGKGFEELPECFNKPITEMMDKTLISMLADGLEKQIENQIGKTPGENASKKERDAWNEQREKIKRETIKKIAGVITQVAEPGGMNIPEEKQENFNKMVIEPIKEWWPSVEAKESKKYGTGLAKSRYARLEVDLSGTDPEEKLKEMINNEELFAYFVIGPDPVGDKPVEPIDDVKEMVGDAAPANSEETQSSECVCKYVSNNLTDMDLRNWFSRNANAVIRSKRLASSNISKKTADWLQAPIVFESKKISEVGAEEEVEDKDEFRQWVPAGFTYILWISVFVIAQMLLTNTIEEKSNKIMEVLLSSVSPIQLMAGKILGIASTGLTMVASWVIFALISIKCLPLFLEKAPPFDIASVLQDPVYLLSFLAYFILGYLLLSAILVGIGSVCNSLKEAQNLMGPVTIIMIVPLMALVPISQDPNGTIAKVMSYIPPFTPFVMMNRAAGPPSTMEYIITTILLVVSVMITLWAAAKIFRIGILMTGKPPKPLEILRWIRAPVGQIPTRKE